MKASIKKITLFLACAFCLTSCDWGTITVRHIFFECRFNLSEVYGTWFVDGVEHGADLKSYFKLSLKTTYLDLHAPIQTDENLTPRFSDFQFHYDATNHSFVETQGVYYGLANPHESHGLFFLTFDDTKGIDFSSFQDKVDVNDTRKKDPNYDDIKSRTFCFNFPDYYLITGYIRNFMLDDGTPVNARLTFKSERWGG